MFAFGNFLGNDIDAENVASGIFQWVPVGKPDTLCVTAVRSLAADLYARDGLAGSENRLDDVLDLIGNLWDRIFNRRVVDFLDFFLGNYHWPVFNIADSAIVTGAMLLVLEILSAKSRENAESTSG